MNKKFTLVIRASATNILNFYFNKNSIFLYEYKNKNISLNHITYNEIINNYSIVKSDNDFLKIWIKNKRYIQDCYRRESSKKISNLEIRNIAESHYLKITNFFKKRSIEVIVFEENPHIFMDVMFYLAGINSTIKCVFHEFFFQNSILCQTVVVGEKITSNVIKHSLGAEGKKNLNFKIKLIHLLKKKIAFFFGGGVRWNSVVINNGEYCSIDFFSKILLSMRRENYLNHYRKLLLNLKNINPDGLDSRDLVIYFHVQPESSTTPYGNEYADQIYSSYVLAKKFPKRKIIIKEHPALFRRNEKKPLTIYSFRNIRLLRRLMNIPNIYYGTEDFSKSNCWIVSINGTILKERANLQLKCLVLNNLNITAFSSRKTWFMNNLKIVKRGSLEFELDSTPKLINRSYLELDNI